MWPAETTGKMGRREEDDRPKWRSSTEFLLSMIGYAVGIGNVWRFPYLCFTNGGAAFLIPYLVILIFLGTPLFALEISIGQLFNKDNLALWPAISPHLWGVGITAIAVDLLVSIYYCVIFAWALFYLGASFISPLPWTGGDDDGMVDAVRGYFIEDVLNRSEDVNHIGDVSWQLALCNTVAWSVTYLMTSNGIESSGRAVYFTATFPYLVLTILVIRGVTLPGAGEGLRYYLVPDMEKLKDYRVWVLAAQQVFFSLGVGWGTHVTFGSYNNRSHNFLFDSLFVPLVNAGTSFFAGFSVFGTLGYLAHISGVDVADLDAGGFGLAFVAYPAALARIPAAAFFSVLFFLMLAFLAIDSMAAYVETISAALIESGLIPEKMRCWTNIAVCFTCWALGFFCISRGGLYFINILDSLSVGLPPFAIALTELVATTYILGIDRFTNDLEEMVGAVVAKQYALFFRYLKFCWLVASPVLSVLVIIVSVYDRFTTSFKPLVCADPDASSCDGSVSWGIALGNTICVIAISFIPLGAAWHHWKVVAAKAGATADQGGELPMLIKQPTSDAI